MAGGQAGERQLRMRARGTTGSVAGAANYNSGSRPIVSPRPARPVSPEAPRPGARTLREGPSSVQAALLSIFMQVQPGEAAPRSCVSDPNQSDQPSGIGGERRSRVPSGSAWRSHPRVHKSHVINGLCPSRRFSVPVPRAGIKAESVTGRHPRSLVFDIGYRNSAPLIASQRIGRRKPSSADPARPSMDRGNLGNYRWMRSMTPVRRARPGACPAKAACARTRFRHRGRGR